MNNALKFLIDHQFIASLIALPIVMGLNILLGRAIANFKKEFDKEVFILGIKKGAAVYFTIAVLSCLAQFVKVAEIQLISTMALIVYSVMLSYLKQVIDKMQTVLGYKKGNQ